MSAKEPESELVSLQRANQELRALNERLRSAQDQLLQAERLASIGQLAAGVAHEINNPIGYVFSNFGTLEAYLQRLFEMLQAYEQAEAALAGSAVASHLAALRERVELGYLKQDIPMLMAESKEGLSRVRKIVQDLKDFSRVDTHQEWVWASLHQGMASTLNIVANEIKYRADVRCEYGSLPDIECLPSELNQVFLNLLVNAALAAPRSGSRSRTTAAASHPNTWRASSTPSSPPSRWAAARAWACRWPTASCRSTRAASRCAASRAAARVSASPCRCVGGVSQGPKGSPHDGGHGVHPSLDAARRR